MICTLDMTQKLNEPSPVDKQMDVLCAQASIPSFMAETGHSEWAETEYIDFAAQGARNVMQYYNVLPGEPMAPENQIILSSREVIRCKHDGLAIAQVKPHQFVKKVRSSAKYTTCTAMLLKRSAPSMICIQSVFPISPTSMAASVSPLLEPYNTFRGEKS